MDKKTIRTKLLGIAVPIMLSNLISQTQMLIDRIFLGRLNILAMSAVGNATSPMWTTMSIVFSLSIGSAILISQEIGAGNKERAREIGASMCKYINIISTVMFLVWMFLPKQIFMLMGVSDEIMEMAVSYARGYAPAYLAVGAASAVSTLLQVSEKTGIMVAFGIVRSVVNIILDYALIFGNLGMPRLEVKGAAIATLIADLTGDLVVMIYVIRNDDLWIKPSFNEIINADVKPYIESIKLGIPTALEGFAWNFGNLFLMVMLNRISIEAAGIYSIVFGMELIPICFIDSIGTATLTLSGQETGRKNYKGIAGIVNTAFVWCAVVDAFMLTMFIIFPQTIMGWFTTDEKVIAAAAVYLIIVGVDLFPKSGNILVGGGIKGYGSTKWMFGTQLFGTAFIISMSALMVLVFHMGIAQLFIVVVADETIRCIINSFKLKRIVQTN